MVFGGAGGRDSNGRQFDVVFTVFIKTVVGNLTHDHLLPLIHLDGKARWRKRQTWRRLPW